MELTENEKLIQEEALIFARNNKKHIAKEFTLKGSVTNENH